MASIVIPFMFVFQLTNLTVMRLVRYPEEESMIVPRVLVTILGMLFAFGILAIQKRARLAVLWKRSIMALALGALGAVWHALWNVVIYSLFHEEYAFNFGAYWPALFDWLWFYTAVSVMILALTYAADLADNRDEIASLQALANATQLRALRYQLNPHFLFNTLNSIASLVRRKNNEDAEAMVESLSDFLRSSLKIDPDVEIALGDEIALQSRYLDIERLRFPHRLHVTVDVPDRLRDALVPNLILQPLVENAIKHGVARSSKLVHVALLARESDGTLHLEVRDDGGDAPTAAAGGANVGLRNVSERLKLHFGGAARFEAGPIARGGYSARIEMPVKRGV